MNYNILLYAATWLINIFFWISLIPQVVVNFRLKTTRGISDYMLYLYFVGYITYTYYIFCLGLPLAYKIVAPICFATVLVMVIQRFFYEQGYKKSRLLLLFYICNLVVAAILLPYARYNAFLVGSVSGWIQVIVWMFYQVPQIIKVQIDRSVFGFSFLFVTFIALGEIVELMIAIALKFPIQTIVNSIRGQVMYSIFCVQFLKFRKKYFFISKNTFESARDKFDPMIKTSVEEYAKTTGGDCAQP